MKRTVLLLLVLAAVSGSASAAAPILETDGPANFDIKTAEILIGSYTASANTEIIAQARCLSGLTATAANIQFRLEHATGADVVMAYQVDIVCRAKFAAANTAFGTRNLGGNGFTLLTGEKAKVYAFSTNATDTIVSCQVDWIDALALPTGAATAAVVATEIDNHGIPSYDQVLEAISSGVANLLTAESFNSAMAAVAIVLGAPAQAGEAAAASSQGEAAAAVVGLAMAANVSNAQTAITSAITSATAEIVAEFTGIPADVWNYLVASATTAGSFGKFIRDLYQ